MSAMWEAPTPRWQGEVPALCSGQRGEVPRPASAHGRPQGGGAGLVTAPAFAIAAPIARLPATPPAGAIRTAAIRRLEATARALEADAP